LIIQVYDIVYQIGQIRKEHQKQLKKTPNPLIRDSS